jgi:hypothetical protein
MVLNASTIRAEAAMRRTLAQLDAAEKQRPAIKAAARVRALIEFADLEPQCRGCPDIT